MTEETLFAAALEKPTKANRASFLEEACAGDSALRRRIEALLESHDDAEFLKTSAAERAAIAFGGDATTEAAVGTDLEFPIDFVTPSEKAGSLGRLGHYEVLEVIGRGGMGIVLRAFDEKLHRVVAIKVMAAQLATSATARRRFAREAQAAAAVCHDHIVTIHAVDEAGGLPYLVMQYVAGMSLQERLECRGPLQLHEILRIGMQAASGLAAAHAQGLIHRDIKPANILLENGVERVKITDFGLARAADDASLTQSGVVAGTPQFMAPEQARGEAVDRRSDLFSLGSVLYAMCTGRAPFRAGGTMAVLKRVCEEAPGPIREANPEVPDWLVAIVEKLHAKDPVHRYQSAAEVAEVLGQHLALLQHPSVVTLPVSGKPTGAMPIRHRRHWAVVAAGLLCLLVGVGFSEATGVTKMTATVIRILTPDGTLVVEANDADVKVTIEGDGGLVITGAGPQEVRLRPGSYRLHATKDGKPVPLDRDLVTVTRADKQVVRVRLEGKPGAGGAVAGVEPGAFVLVGVGERSFDTLAEAVAGSADGDIIEVRGNGPFVVDHTEFKHPLTVRAGAGFRPVLTAAPKDNPPSGNLFVSYSPLRLEGLEVHCNSEAYRILDAQGPLWIANCRFQFVTGGNVCIESHVPCVVKNCEMVARGGAALAFRCDSEATLSVMNNVLVGQINLGEFDLSRGATLQFAGNTIVSPFCSPFLHLMFEQRARPSDPLERRVQVFATENVVSSAVGAYGFVQGEALPNLSPNEAEAWARRRLEWREEGNRYQVDLRQMIQIRSEGVVHTTSHTSLADWDRFWGSKGTRSPEGVVRFRGGDLNARVVADAEKLALGEFRLRSDSAGYRAGPDGKDLGADVDLVGPGAAYERWKRTPDYQGWLKETGQVK